MVRASAFWDAAVELQEMITEPIHAVEVFRMAESAGNFTAPSYGWDRAAKVQHHTICEAG